MKYEIKLSRCGLDRIALGALPDGTITLTVSSSQDRSAAFFDLGVLSSDRPYRRALFALLSDFYREYPELPLA